MNEIIWGQGRFIISEETKSKLRRVYSDFDRQLEKMEMWYIANPTKRKKNHYRFIVNWCNKTKQKQEIFRTYSKENEEQKKKIEEMKKECAPPPSEWALLKARLKGGVL